MTKHVLGSFGAQVATLCAPLDPGQPCGDAAVALPLPGADGLLLVIVDGLGHGAPAAHAAELALDWLAGHADQALPRLLDGLDGALRDSRGAAVGLAQCVARPDGVELAYGGVGNTRAMRWRDGTLQRLCSQYGIVGSGQSHPPEITRVDLRPGDWVLMFTDGLDEGLRLPTPLPEWERDPSLLCAHLLAGQRRGSDDVGVLAFHLAADRSAA